MRPILLATDGSPSARKATEEAIALAKATGWRLAAIAVWQVALTNFAFDPVAVVPEVAEAEEARARRALAAAADAARAAGLELEEIVAEGDPVEAICETAADRDAALVVIGSHGWGTIRRLLFGSVSGGVLHHSERPVLVVRGDAAPRETRAAA